MNIKTVSHKGNTFVYCSKLGQAETNYLRSNFNLSNLHLEDHLNKTELPKIESTKEYVLIVLGFPHVSNGEAIRQEKEEADKNGIPFRRLLNIPHQTLSHLPIPKFNSYTRRKRISTTYIDIYVGKNYVVVVSDGAVSQIDHILELCQRTTRGREEFFGQGLGFLAYRIVDALLDGYFPIVNAISGVIDRIDNEMEKRQTPGTLEEISLTRRNIVVLHTMNKTIISLFKKLRDGTYQEFGLNGSLRSYWESILDHGQTLLERLEDDRELIEGISESNEFLLRSRTNEVMITLTIAFTLTIPASLFGTFYGMNILLPGGLQDGSWTFWGPFTSFYIIAGISILFMIIMILYFKHKRWF